MFHGLWIQLRRHREHKRSKWRVYLSKGWWADGSLRDLIALLTECFYIGGMIMLKVVELNIVVVWKVWMEELWSALFSVPEISLTLVEGHQGRTTMGVKYQTHVRFPVLVFFLIVCLFASDDRTTRTDWYFWLQVIFCTENSKVIKTSFVLCRVSKCMS